jgi:hypothetical protein
MDASTAMWIGGLVFAALGSLLGIVYYQLAVRVNAFEERYVSKELFREMMATQNRTLERIERAVEGKESRWPRGRPPGSSE